MSSLLPASASTSTTSPPASRVARAHPIDRSRGSRPLVVTGAAGGLGRAVALEAAHRGWDLVLTDRVPLSHLATYLGETSGRRVDTVTADLATVEGRDHLFAALPPRIGGLVNVAGVDDEGPFAERAREDLLAIVRVNVEATVDLTRELVARRDPDRRFVLITVCSLAAVTPMPYKATYAAAKRFVHDFSLALREELGDEATVTALCPSGLPTSAASVRGIYAQGLLGRITSVSAGQAAAAAFDAAEAGRAVCVPGPGNRWLYRLAALAPTGIRVRAVGRRWARARRDPFRRADEALAGPTRAPAGRDAVEASAA